MSTINIKEEKGVGINSGLFEMQELMSSDYLEGEENSDSSGTHNTTQESVVSINLNESDQDVIIDRSNSVEIETEKNKRLFLETGSISERGLDDLAVQSTGSCPPDSPNDKWRCVWSMMIVLGICSALPYNLLIVVHTYLPRTLQVYSNVTGVETDDVTIFLSYLILSSKLPVLIIVSINTYFFHKSPVFFGKMASPRRLVIMALIMIAMSIIAQMFALVIALEWLYLFSWICMLAIIFSNVAGAVFQNSLFGMAFTLPTSYINAVLIGSNFCGMCTSLIVIIMIASAPRIRNLITISIILILLIFLVSLLICYLIRNMPFYEHYRQKVWTKETELERKPLLYKKRLKFQQLHKKLWMTSLNLWLVHMITSVNYPIVGSHVKRLALPFPDNYWSPFWFFLVFNTFSFVGNILSEFFQLWHHKLLWLATFSRAFVFLPFFLLCNYQPDGIKERTLPVILNTDYIFIFGTILLGISSGYYTSVCMMYSQRKVNTEDTFVAGMLMNSMVYAGMFSGSFISMFFPLIVSSKHSD